MSEYQTGKDIGELREKVLNIEERLEKYKDVLNGLTYRVAELQQKLNNDMKEEKDGAE